MNYKPRARERARARDRSTRARDRSTRARDHLTLARST
jgi:hypothetical protein